MPVCRCPLCAPERCDWSPAGEDGLRVRDALLTMQMEEAEAALERRRARREKARRVWLWVTGRA